MYKNETMLTFTAKFKQDTLELLFVTWSLLLSQNNKEIETLI